MQRYLFLYHRDAGPDGRFRLSLRAKRKERKNIYSVSFQRYLVARDNAVPIIYLSPRQQS